VRTPFRHPQLETMKACQRVAGCDSTFIPGARLPCRWLDRGVHRRPSGLEPDSIELSAGIDRRHLHCGRVLSNVAEVASVNSDRSNRAKALMSHKARENLCAILMAAVQTRGFVTVPATLRSPNCGTLESYPTSV
jgi:hypothetical protein